MKPIATDTYNFKGLITRGYTYVDKTEVLYPLINDSIGFYQFGALRKYDLGFPNLEVQNSFITKLAPAYTGLEPSTAESAQIAAAEAMEQIKGKDYAGKYALSGKRMTLIGISFSSEKRTIVEEIVDEMEGEGTRKGTREKVRR